MTEKEAYDRLRTFVGKDLLNGDDGELDAETPLLAWGILDSMALLRLTEFIEEEMKVAIPTDELSDANNLQTLTTITKMVMKHA